MKQIFLPFLADICLTTSCNNDNKESAKNETSNTSSAATSLKAEDAAAIATIETEDYILKVHKAIPFAPDASKTAGAFTPKDGNKFVALDVSVKSKASQSIEMGAIMLTTEITDEKGTKFGGTVPVLTAYSLTYPDSKFQDEYDAIWNDFPANAFHRTTALGFEAPKDVKTFMLKVPVKAYGNEKKEVTFTL
jgi:hypothetical protein